MQRLIFLVSVLGWLATATIVAPQAAQADETLNAQDGVCTEHHAEWRNFSYDSEAPSPPGIHKVDIPDGTQTQILACKLGTHYVRINSLDTASYGIHDCQINSQGYVSAWVDGVKVVFHEAWSQEKEFCHVDIPKGLKVISKIIINDQLHLTICHRLAENNGGDADEDSPETCTVTALHLDPKKREPDYDGELKRTKPGYNLIMSAHSVCNRITADNGADNAALLNPAIKLMDVDSVSEEQHDKLLTESFHADIDNDGTVDKLTHELTVYDYGSTQEALRWTNGKTGKTYSIDDALDVSKTTDTFSAKSAKFFLIDGRTYLFLEEATYGGEDLALCYLSGLGLCKDTGSGDDKHLYTIRGDGSAQELCRWMPRARPEEVL